MRLKFLLGFKCMKGVLDPGVNVEVFLRFELFASMRERLRRCHSSRALLLCLTLRSCDGSSSCRAAVAQTYLQSKKQRMRDEFFPDMGSL